MEKPTYSILQLKLRLIIELWRQKTSVKRKHAATVSEKTYIAGPEQD